MINMMLFNPENHVNHGYMRPRSGKSCQFIGKELSPVHKVNDVHNVQIQSKASTLAVANHCVVATKLLNPPS